MKFFSKLFAVMPVIAALLALAIPVRAQVNSTAIVPALTATITPFHLTTNLAASQLITNRVVPGKDMGFDYTLVGQDATNTGVIGFLFNVGWTNKIFTSTKPLAHTNTATGTTVLRGWGVIPAAAIGPAEVISLVSITNSTGNVNQSGAASASIIISNANLHWGN